MVLHLHEDSKNVAMWPHSINGQPKWYARSVHFNRYSHFQGGGTGTGGGGGTKNRVKRTGGQVPSAFWIWCKSVNKLSFPPPPKKIHCRRAWEMGGCGWIRLGISDLNHPTLIYHSIGSHVWSPPHPCDHTILVDTRQSLTHNKGQHHCALSPKCIPTFNSFFCFFLIE